MYDKLKNKFITKINKLKNNLKKKKIDYKFDYKFDSNTNTEFSVEFQKLESFSFEITQDFFEIGDISESLSKTYDSNEYK